MSSEDSEAAAEIERRLRLAAAMAEPDYWPLIGDVMTVLGEERSNVHNWLKKGVRFGGRRIVVRYRLGPGNYRMAHPADILEVLDEMRKVRSADHPEGVPAGLEGRCRCCGQELPNP